MKAVLRREGFAIVESTNGTEALGIVTQLGGKLDLIISDIQMVGGDGISLMRSVQAAFPSIPIILVSGYVDPARIERSCANCRFVQKPFSPHTLLQTVREVLPAG
jgi:two-component system cell cycle sensor histidine kinase/response regulator CckA